MNNKEEKGWEKEIDEYLENENNYNCSDFYEGIDKLKLKDFIDKVEQDAYKRAVEAVRGKKHGKHKYCDKSCVDTTDNSIFAKCCLYQEACDESLENAAKEIEKLIKE